MGSLTTFLIRFFFILQDSSNLKVSKDERADWLQRQISNLTNMHSHAEEELRERHQQNLDLELRKYRRRALLSRHTLEQDLLREVRRTLSSWT